MGIINHAVPEQINCITASTIVSAVTLNDTRGLTPKVSGAGAPKLRRAPTQAMKMEGMAYVGVRLTDQLGHFWN